MEIPSRLNCRPVRAGKPLYGRLPRRFRVDLHDFFCGPQMDTGRFMAGSINFRTMQTGATSSIFTSSFMATMGLESGRATKPDGRDWLPNLLSRAARECSCGEKIEVLNLRRG